MIAVKVGEESLKALINKDAYKDCSCDTSPSILHGIVNPHFDC